MNKNELKIIAYCLDDKNNIPKVLQYLDINCFKENACKQTLKYIKKYYQDYNGVLNIDYLKSKFESGNLNSNGYTQATLTFDAIKNVKTIDAADLQATIDLIRQSRLETLKTEIAQEIIEQNNKPNPDKLEDMMNAFIEFKNFNGTMKTTLLSLNDTDERYDRYTSPEAFDNLMKTGFVNIDKSIGGFKKSELVYIIGRKGAGKSIMMFNLGYNLWKQEKNVLFITLEILKEDYMRRIDSLMTGIKAMELKCGVTDPINQYNLKIAMDRIKNNIDDVGIKHTSKMHILEASNGINTNTIKKLIKDAENKYNIKYDVIVIDYASLLSPIIPKSEDRLRHGQIALDLKTLAKEEDYLVISAAQMNRAGEKDENITSGNIANSDSIADHLDYGIAIKLDNDIMVKVGKISSFKTRDGEPFTFQFNRKYEIFKVEEIDDSIWEDKING